MYSHFFFFFFFLLRFFLSMRKTNRQTCHAQHEILRFQWLIWQVGWLLCALWFFETNSVYIGTSPKEREKWKICERRKKNIHITPLAPTASTVVPCSTIDQTNGMSRHWKLPSIIARPDHPFCCWARCTSFLLCTCKSFKTGDWKASQIQRKYSLHPYQNSFLRLSTWEEDHICNRK